MPLVNAGSDIMAKAVLGEAVTFFNNANARIGVGDSTTNATPLTYVDLQAATNKFRRIMEATFPTALTASATQFKSVFGSAEANYVWNEWGVFNSASGATMLCRKVEALGTKSAGQTWTVTATITFSVGA
jgi:hypothetical protein